MLHDASHNAITQNSKYDHYISTFIANIYAGISVGLWKDEHNTHHVATNHIEHDPDIQLIPFIAITTKMF